MPKDVGGSHKETGACRRKAAILKCDDVLDKFQAGHRNYPEMIIESFSRVDPDIDYQVFDVREGQYPIDVLEFDFYIITGSKASVYDPLPWIADLVEFLKLLERSQLRVFGICFGHQVMAIAKACRVEKSNKGWGVGIALSQISTNSSIDFDGVRQLSLLVSHQDQVCNISSDAELIASSDFCEYFAVRWGEFFISVQGHPEWAAAYSRDLMIDRKGLIPPDVLSLGLASLERETNEDIFIARVLDFLKSA